MKNIYEEIKSGNKKGITLIAVVITVILMLILATVTVKISLNGSLFGKVKNAKNNTEIANEKEIIQNAIIIAQQTSKAGKITTQEMQQALNQVVTEETVTVSNNGKNFLIRFDRNNRYYEVDEKENINGPKEPVKIEFAGDITKNGAYDGSKSKPFKIECIEDLVEFSIMSNGGNTELNIISNTFTNQYIELTNTLDFQSIFSYSDYATTKYGDLNKDGKIEDLKTELTKTEENCIGFSGIGEVKGAFNGEFDGKGNEITNIYINTTSNGKDAGLFEAITDATIKNVGVTGKIISGQYAGGIVCKANGASTIENSYNKIDIVASDSVVISSGTGGICGTLKNGKIVNCYNKGTIEGNSLEGGIAGHCTEGTLENCYNEGKITSYGAKNYNGAGGITGNVYGDICIVKNCYNNGEIYSAGRASAGGIIGQINNTGTTVAKIINCYNLKLVKNNSEIIHSSLSGGIIGKLGTANASSSLVAEVVNCYNLGTVNSTGTGNSDSGGIVGMIWCAGNANDSISINNVVNIGEVSQNAKFKGEIIGRHVKSTICTLENCFYSSKNANQGIGSGKVTGETTSTSIDNNLVTKLNTYVTNYNTTNAGQDNFVSLKTWELNGEKVKFK